MIITSPSSLVETLGSPDSVSVRIGFTADIPIVDHYQAATSGSIIALIGSHGRLEIAVVNGEAAQVIGAKFGDAIVVYRR